MAQSTLALSKTSHRSMAKSTLANRGTRLGCTQIVRQLFGTHSCLLCFRWRCLEEAGPNRQCFRQEMRSRTTLSLECLAIRADCLDLAGPCLLVHVLSDLEGELGSCSHVQHPLRSQYLWIFVNFIWRMDSPHRDDGVQGLYQQHHQPSRNTSSNMIIHHHRHQPLSWTSSHIIRHSLEHHWTPLTHSPEHHHQTSSAPTIIFRVIQYTSWTWQ